MKGFRKPSLDFRLKIYPTYKRRLNKHTAPRNMPLKYYSDCSRHGDLEYKSNIYTFCTMRKETLYEKSSNATQVRPISRCRCHYA